MRQAKLVISCKEQTITFTSHLASISLTAIRYLMLLYVALEQDDPLSEVRTNMSAGLVGLSFGQRLWGLFRCLMSNTVEQFREQLGDMANLIMSTLEESINAFSFKHYNLIALHWSLKRNSVTIYQSK